MFFNSYTFLLFLAVVIPIFYWMPRDYKKLFLLACSYFFYGAWDWRFCFLLLFSTTLDFFVGQQIFKSEVQSVRKKWLTLSLLGNLGILGFFKYFNFFTESFVDLLAKFGQEADFVHLKIILPVGISFYTFQTLSYTIDIYRKKLEPTGSIQDFALFVAFFPQLVAGPIERARRLLPQIQELYRPTKQQIQEGLVLISYGLFQKMLIGDNAGKAVDLVFNNPIGYTSAELVCGVLLFSIQIYADFAGYSLVAIGTGKLVGVDLMTNFQQPFLARNYTDVWRRWHISLSTWFKEYVYFSLGGNRGSIYKTYLNIIIVMTVSGLWHGASWNFVLWGFLSGVVLVFDKWWKRTEIWQPKPNPILNLGSIILTFSTFALLMMIFRADNLQVVGYFLENIFLWDSSDIRIRIGLTTIVCLVFSFTVDIIHNHYQSNTFLLQIEKPYRYAILSVIWLEILTSMATFKPEPYIYFQF